MILKVGQRVRVVRAHHPEHLGLETHITAFGQYRARVGDRLITTTVELAATDARRGLRLSCNPDQLEPILPDGMQPAEWSETLWQPEHMEELA